MNEPADLRASNADREQVVQVLRTAYADGRLSELELDERLASAYAARVRSELEPLVADLPGAWGERAPVAASRAEVVSAAGGGVVSTIVRSGQGIFLLAPIICTAIYLMTDAGGYFWPMWVWFGCGTALALGFVSRR